MGKLLADTTIVRKATAADKLSAALDMVEADFLTGNLKERKMVERLGRQRGVIDISSATSMNLFHDLTEKRIVDIVKKELLHLLEKLHSYPYLIQRDFGLEKTFIAFMRRWARTDLNLDEILVAPGGVYGSYKTILLSQPGKYVLVPESIHQINKACFSSLGKRVREFPNILETGLLNLETLDNELKHHAKDTACVYIYHTKPVNPPSRAYYLQLAEILRRHKVLGVFDLDSWYTSYGPGSPQWLPFTISALRKQCLFLFTMTKEIGAPGLRIGFVVGSKDIISTLKRFKQVNLDMDSPITRFLAEITLPKIDMDKASAILQRRMKALTDGLRSLDFKVTVPPGGVNFFLHVPESFAESKRILPDHLFAFYALREARVLVRPGSNHGHRLNHWVRFVIGQPEGKIKEVIRRFRRARINGMMNLPHGLEKEYEVFMRQIKR